MIIVWGPYLFMSIGYTRARSSVFLPNGIYELQAQPFILVIQGKDKVIDSLDFINWLCFKKKWWVSCK